MGLLLQDIASKSNGRKLGLHMGMALCALLLAVRPSAAADGRVAAALAIDNQGVAADPNLPGSLEDKTKPSNRFMTAYNSMVMADWLKEKGMQTEAADLYTEALELFGKLAADYPQWQPTLVAFRINYCRESLKNLMVPRAGGERQAARRSLGEGGAADPPTPKRFPLREAASAGQVGGQAPDAGLPAVASEAKAGRPTPDPGRQTPDAGRQAMEQRAMKNEGGVKKQTPNAESKTKNQEPRTKNKAQESSNAMTLSPLNAKLQQAAFKERGRDYTGALTAYIALLEEYPREPSALKGACRCYLRLERMDRARALTRQALALPAPDADMHLLAALVDCYDGRYQAALPLLRQSLTQNGACPEAHVALGVTLAAAGQMEEAQKEMKRALALNPRLGDVYYNLARLSLQQKPTDRDTARVHYQNALRYGAAPDPELDKWLAE